MTIVLDSRTRIVGTSESRRWTISGGAVVSVSANSGSLRPKV
ncbi:MAG TPA: hypothetical protein VMD27_06250 [Candidatus Aquilonibacter sp.]|nr:hypothetical protein [Candidatus Aquilonibacter sp.]